ncbi:MAG: NADH-quinone oxidoreductase subunit C [Chloroflexota bacterium]
MTTVLSGSEVSKQIAGQFAGAVTEAAGGTIQIKNEQLFDVVRYLKQTPGLDFDYLTYITAVDYFDYFEVVYQLTSTSHNHSLVLKTRLYDRENPKVGSIISLYKGADFQEREIYDLLGITFEGHPNLKRIVLWDGFNGHPLRKDYL